MGREAIEGIVTVAMAIVGVGFIAVLVSRNANTAGVLQASGAALAQGLSAAQAPITGGAANFSYGWTGGPPSDFGSF